MTNQKRRYSEWKIWCKDIREQRIAGVDTGDDVCHVIEYSAYEQAIKERDDALRVCYNAGVNSGALIIERDEARAEIERLKKSNQVSNDRCCELLLWKQRMDESYNRSVRDVRLLETRLNQVIYESDKKAKERDTAEALLAQAEALLAQAEALLAQAEQALELSLGKFNAIADELDFTKALNGAKICREALAKIKAKRGGE